MKPKAHTSKRFNINELASDRIFEELLHRIFEYRIKDDLKGIVEFAFLNSGVGEKGVDIQLKKKGKNVGAVQCKMNTSQNLNKPTAIKEIIKFCLYYYQDNTLINNISDFNYYFVCSNKFAGTTIALLSNFNSLVFQEADIQKWTTEIIKKYKSFKGLTFLKVESFLKTFLKKINITPISYSELNGFLNKYPEIASEFFDIMKVVDTKTVKTGLSDIIEILNPDLEKKIQETLPLYYKSCKSYLDSVNFIGHDSSFSNPRNITVSKLYVEPRFTPYSYNPKTETKNKIIENYQNLPEIIPSVRINEVFKKAKNYIILGEPGAGKSLTIKSLVLKFIQKKAKTGGLKKYQSHIPFRIELRKYSEKRIKDDMGIIEYLVFLLKKDYQLSNINEELITYVIKNKPTLFFFDGLDEIFDVYQKKCVRDDIVNFTSINTKIKCIITSRFIGFREVSFPEEKFNTFSIKSFNQKQINSFIEKFYKLQIKNKPTREKEIRNCKEQLKQVEAKLKSNPLILSLMALLSINKIVIPDSKLQVYRACTNTLVDTRDQEEKQLKFDLKVNSKRGTFGHLAFWQYKQVTEKNKINRPLVKKSIIDYLISENECSNIYSAGEYSEQFLKYAEKRSIYFDDNFTHKTFLEYYAADFIFAKYHNGFLHDERDKIILKYVNNKAWHIVFELLISMIDELVLSTGILDKLITPLLESNEKNTYYFLLTILPNTKYISPNIQKVILKKSLLLIIEDPSINLNRILQDRLPLFNNTDSSDFSELFLKIALLSNSHKTIQQIFSDFESTLSEDDQLIKLYIFLLEINNRKIDKSKEYTILNQNKINELALKNIYIYTYINVDSEKVKLINQIKHFGKKSIFKEIPTLFTKMSLRFGIFSIYIIRNSFISEEELLKDIRSLEKQGFTNSDITKHYNPVIVNWSIDKNVTPFIKMLKLYIKSNDEKVSQFLKTILMKISKSNFLSIKDTTITSTPKYIELLSLLP